jgi:hypothetical protein
MSVEFGGGGVVVFGSGFGRDGCDGVLFADSSNTANYLGP